MKQPPRAVKAHECVRIELNHPMGFRRANRKADAGGLSRPIVKKKKWNDLPGWIMLHAERGAVKKCWNGFVPSWTSLTFSALLGPQGRRCDAEARATDVSCQLERRSPHAPQRDPRFPLNLGTHVYGLVRVGVRVRVST